MIFRRQIGFLVALAFSWKRRGALRSLRAGGRLPVVFHHLPADEFGQILDWFAARGVADRLWITLDDGWRVARDYLPHLQQHGLKAKLFIAPGETARGSVWTETALRAGIPSATWRSWYGLDEAARCARMKDVPVERTLLTKDEIVELAKTGCVEIENHTWSHLSATSRPADEVMDEIARAQAELTAWTGRAPQFVAWPFGRGNDELDARVRALGLEPVYTNAGRPNGRTMAIEDVTVQENIGRLLGAWPKVGETL